MRKFLGKLNNEHNVFEHNWKATEKSVGGLNAEGMIYRFWRWLQWFDYSDDTIDDVWNNISNLRDGNRLDIHDNYRIADGIEIAYLYYINDMCWAVLYDRKNDRWYGEIEIESR